MSAKKRCKRLKGLSLAADLFKRAVIIALFFLISEVAPETYLLSPLRDQSLGLNFANNFLPEPSAIRGWLHRLARKGLL